MRKSEILPVTDTNGHPRSGKGSIGEAIVNAHNGEVVSLETGATYRTVTWRALERGEIDPSMPRDVISKKLAETSFELITLDVASRDALIASKGLQELYTPNVRNTVSAVSRVPQVRTAVIADFVKRVEAVRDDPTKSAAVIDGRNLYPVLQTIPGVEIPLRLFTTCTPKEAALRECLASGVDFDSPEGQAILAAAKLRYEEDTEREVDKVKPDSDAIEYWEYVERPDMMNGHSPAERNSHIVNLARFAMREHRQIVLDTSRYRPLQREHPDRPKQAMSEDVNVLFDAALKLAA